MQLWCLSANRRLYNLTLACVIFSWKTHRYWSRFLVPLQSWAPPVRSRSDPVQPLSCVCKFIDCCKTSIMIDKIIILNIMCKIIIDSRFWLTWFGDLKVGACDASWSVLTDRGRLPNSRCQRFSLNQYISSPILLLPLSIPWCNL